MDSALGAGRQIPKKKYLREVQRDAFIKKVYLMTSKENPQSQNELPKKLHTAQHTIRKDLKKENDLGDTKSDYLVPHNVQINSSNYIITRSKPLLEKDIPKLHPGETNKVFVYHDAALSHTSAKTKVYAKSLKKFGSENEVWVTPDQRCRSTSLSGQVNQLEDQTKNRGGWVREWVLRRENYGACNNLLHELRTEDAQQFKNFIGMLAVDLEELLSKVGTRIKKQDTHLRASISPRERQKEERKQEVFQSKIEDAKQDCGKKIPIPEE
ncbi:hypothetical protein ILUMI_20496 [Ignelater luminosus]|uniref:Uncharacterized protein n=1 Tax=Ignelater luminosus TaxID=2038154 RepID=A0A8K0CJP2_IGNLU|nr:hypothetical protein ILUMI_20496 [Ignelater luminosus]